MIVTVLSIYKPLRAFIVSALVSNHRYDHSFNNTSLLEVNPLPSLRMTIAATGIHKTPYGCNAIILRALVPYYSYNHVFF
jgi:hypothetical protein